MVFEEGKRADKLISDKANLGDELQGMSFRRRNSQEGELGACFGMDIGGTLAKLVFLEEIEVGVAGRSGGISEGDSLVSPEGVSEAASADPVLSFMKGGQSVDTKEDTKGDTKGDIGSRDLDLSVHIDELGGSLHFLHFPTFHFDRAIDFVRANIFHRKIQQMHVTGGGAHLFKDQFRAQLGIEVRPLNELGTVVAGIAMMAQYVRDECFTVQTPDLGLALPLVRVPLELEKNATFPFLLCNIGTGVSIVHVRGPRDWSRVSGSALGGGTFFGLCKLLTKATTFKTAMNMAANGDASSVNTLVKDIYGPMDSTPINGPINDPEGMLGEPVSTLLAALQLDGNLTASFFAKVIANPDQAIRQNVSDEDISQALCIMIAQNITHIAHLNARLHNLQRIFFTGNFLRHNEVALKTITYAMDRWSELDNNYTSAVFFRHEGYFGSIGALLESRTQTINSTNHVS